MKHLSSLFAEGIVPEPARVQEPTIQLLEAPAPVNLAATASAAFETDAFNQLLEQRNTLGIASVWKCRSVRVDGLVDLETGERLIVEVKYRMNWAKACQSNSQVRWFLAHPKSATNRPAGAIVIFEQFSGDWARTAPSKFLEGGWNYWYAEHHDLDGFPVHLICLRDGAFHSYADALAVAQQV